MSARRSALAAVVAAATVLTGGPVAAAPPAPELAASAGFFVFTDSSPFGPDGLFIIRADGTGERQLIRGVSASAPAVSPDGRRVAYIDRTEGEIRVRAIEGRGRGHVLAQTDGFFSSLSWSPNGRKLVTIITDADRPWGDLMAITVRTAATSMITASPDTPEGAPMWSPDGKHILLTAPGGRGCTSEFGSERDYYDLFQIRANGAGLHILPTDGNLSLAIADWSSARDTLVVDGEEFPGDGDRSDLCEEPVRRGTWLTSLKGGDVTYFSARGVMEFSPDGTEYAFLKPGAVVDDLWVAPSVGGRGHLVRGAVESADWSADPVS